MDLARQDKRNVTTFEKGTGQIHEEWAYWQLLNIKIQMEILAQKISEL